jgi:hypothetical protein
VVVSGGNVAVEPDVAAALADLLGDDVPAHEQREHLAAETERDPTDAIYVVDPSVTPLEERQGDKTAEP